MSWWNEQLRRAGQLFRRNEMDADLAEEMRLHLDLRSAENPQTERDARVRFGNVTRLKEESRAAWGWPFLESLIQDVRYGVRTLALDRAFTITAIVSLTLGIGANTAIFSIVNALMLRTLPVENPGQLVQLVLGGSMGYTNPLWEATRDQQRAFSGMLATGSDRFDLNEGGEAHFARGLWVSGDYFRVLGVPALRGRVFTTDDDRHGGGTSGPVAVISYNFWKNNYASDPDIVGKTIKLNRKKFVVIGVTPAWFTGLENDSQFDVAVPIGCEPLFHTDRSALMQRSWWWLRPVGRLLPGESIAQAESRMNAAAPEIVKATVPNWDADGQKRYLARRFTLKPLATGFSNTGTQYRIALFTLMALVAVVLLIVCANVANLLLARSTARQRELSVRLAIGAGRGRILRQLLTESLLLSITGATGGLALAVWGSRLLVHFLATNEHEVQIDTSLDWTAGFFIAAVVIGITFLFGLAPAFRGANASPSGVLKENARGTVRGGGRITLGKALVTLQVALSLLLLVGAALFGETFRRLVTVDTGFDSRNVQLVSAQIPQSLIATEQRTAVFERVLERLRTVPGVASASRSDLTPISNSVWNGALEADGGIAQPEKEDDRMVYFNRISPGYLQTMGTPILAGRDFSNRDTINSPKVVIISESSALGFWGPGVNPIGRMVRTPAEPGRPAEAFEVVGVVKDIKYEELSEKTLRTAYFPYLQDPEPRPETAFQLRLNQPPALVLPLVRTAVGEVDKNISIQIHSLDRQLADSLIQPRLVAILASFFGAVALILAATGLYGIIAYSVARRRAEIGLRMALGARYGSVLWLVLRDVAVMLALGGAAGLVASHYATRLVGSLIFGVKPTDPVLLSLSVAVLVMAAAVAGYIPARKAARMDPMDALRTE